MAKACDAIAARARLADVIIEVRDARLPLTSASVLADLPELAAKRRIIVFNKADLACDNLRARAIAHVRRAERRAGAAASPCLFSASSAPPSGAPSSPPLSAASSASALRGAPPPPRSPASALLALVAGLPAPRSARFREAGTTLLVCGASNVGKSSLINALRNAAGGVRSGRGAKTGAAPGVTRGVSTFCVRRAPLVWVFDSPGVVPPRVRSAEDGMKLVVAGILPDAAVPAPAQAEFLLHCFARLRASRYIAALGLGRAYGPDETGAALEALALRLCARLPGGAPDLDAAARLLVREFRRGALGRITLDDLPPLTLHEEAEEAAADAAEAEEAAAAAVEAAERQQARR